MFTFLPWLPGSSELKFNTQKCNKHIILGSWYSNFHCSMWFLMLPFICIFTDLAYIFIYSTLPCISPSLLLAYLSVLQKLKTPNHLFQRTLQLMFYVWFKVSSISCIRVRFFFWCCWQIRLWRLWFFCIALPLSSHLFCQCWEAWNCGAVASWLNFLDSGRELICQVLFRSCAWIPSLSLAFPMIVNVPSSHDKFLSL